MENEMLIYRSADGSIKIDVRMGEETVWLTQDQMAALFDRDKSVISRHLKNIFEEHELNENSVVAKFATTAADGKNYDTNYYNLDVIISVGYRVKSHQGTQFRIWATQVLRVPHQGLRAERRTDEDGQIDELFRRAAGAHPRNPPFGTGVLPKGQGHLHDEHRL
jgi:hypothetical protein